VKFKFTFITFFIFLKILKSIEEKKQLLKLKISILPPIIPPLNTRTARSLLAVYLSWHVRKKEMTVVQTALVFVRVAAIPLHKVTAGFIIFLLQQHMQ